MEGFCKKFSKHWGSDCQKATCCFAHSEKDWDGGTAGRASSALWSVDFRSRSFAAKLQPGILFTQLLEVHDSDVWTLYANAAKNGPWRKYAPNSFLEFEVRVERPNNKSKNRHTTILSSGCTGLHVIFVIFLYVYLTDNMELQCIHPGFVSTSNARFKRCRDRGMCWKRCLKVETECFRRCFNFTTGERGTSTRRDSFGVGQAVNHNDMWP